MGIKSQVRQISRNDMKYNTMIKIVKPFSEKVLYFSEECCFKPVTKIGKVEILWLLFTYPFFVWFNTSEIFIVDLMSLTITKNYVKCYMREGGWTGHIFKVFWKPPVLIPVKKGQKVRFGS